MSDLPRGFARSLRPVTYFSLWRRFPRRMWRSHVAFLRHPVLGVRVGLRVDGLISLFTGVLLYDCVMRCRASSPYVVEMGAYKGLSTCYLSRAAARCGKRVRVFESFCGLPSVDPELDAYFKKGDFACAEEDFHENIARAGVPGVVSLTVGDALQTMPPALSEKGFCVAFVDVDTYEVTRGVLQQLAMVLRGGEIIVVHDAHLPGVRRAVSEFTECLPYRYEVADHGREGALISIDKQGVSRVESNEEQSDRVRAARPLCAAATAGLSHGRDPGL